MDRIEAVLKHVDGPVVLDLGGVQHDLENRYNADWLHAHLTKKFERVVGVDYLEGAVVELNKAGYEFIHANVETMALDLEADTVVAGELIEHVSNPGLMLDRIADHLRPGGRLIITTPNPWYVYHIKAWLRGGLTVNGEHVAWFGPTVLRQLLGRHGFDVRSIVPTSDWKLGPLAKAIRPFANGIFLASTWVCVAEYRGGTQ